MGKIVAVVNPYAGGWKGYPEGESATGRRMLLTRWMGAEQEALSVLETCGPGDGVEQTRRALAEGCETVVAVGGDGTVREVCHGLLSTGGGKLAVLPIGTVNVLARALNIPLFDPAAAGRVLHSGEVRQLDVGRCGDQYFTLMAGVGLDGAVVHSINPKWKRRMGGTAYLLTAFRLAMRLPRQQITVTVEEGDPQTYDAYQVLLANTAEYGGSFRLGSEVKPDDGLLDVFICRRRGPLIIALLSDLNALARGRFSRVTAVRHLQARRVKIEAEVALPVQLDGDSAGNCPITVECIPSALSVHVPGSTLPSGLV